MSLKTKYYWLIFTFVLLNVYTIVSASPIQNEYSRIFEENDYDALYKMIAHAKNSKEVSLIIWKLQRLNDHRASDLIVDLWEQKNVEELELEYIKQPIVKLSLASALVEFGYYNSKDCENYINSKLNSQNVEIKLSSITALSFLGDKHSVSILTALLLDEDVVAAVRAVSSLKYIAMFGSRRIQKAIGDSAYEVLTRNEGNQELQKVVRDEITAALQYMKNKRIYKARQDEDFPSKVVSPKTLKLLEPYAKHGDAHAQFVLSELYFNGDGVLKSQKEAVHWLDKAIKAKYTPAMVALSIKYELGVDVEKNYGKAIALLEDAAKLGDKDAQARLGRAYSEGLLGLDRDIEKGKYWMNKAFKEP